MRHVVIVVIWRLFITMESTSYMIHIDCLQCRLRIIIYCSHCLFGIQSTRSVVQVVFYYNGVEDACNNITWGNIDNTSKDKGHRECEA